MIIAFRTLALWVFSILLIGCGHTPQKQRSVFSEPVSKQVTFIESSGVNRSLYEAWGEGKTIKEAKLEAQKTALWAALYLGDQALLNSPLAKKKFAPFAKNYYTHVTDYVRYLSRPLSKRIEGNKVKLRLRVAIDVQQLREQLQFDGVLVANDTVNAQIGLPSVVVLPKSTLAKVAANTVEQYLGDQGFSLVDKKANEKVAHLTEQVAKLSGQIDPMYLLASQTGADVYVETDATVQSIEMVGVKGQQASVQVRAYETASSQLLGSATGYSEKRVGTASEALVQEAANDAASRLTAKLVRAWQQQAKLGSWFKVVIGLDPQKAQDQEEAVYQAIKALKPTQMKRLQAGSSSVSYLIRLRGISDAMALFLALKDHYLGSGQLKRELEVGRLLILRLDQGEGEMQLD